MPETTITTISEPSVIIVGADTYRPYFAVKLVKNGVTRDVTHDLLKLSVRKKKGGVWQSTVLLNNSGRGYNFSLTGGELVKIYLDYVDGTTLFYQGKMGKPLFGLNMELGVHAILHSRQTPELVDDKISASFTDNQANLAIQSVLDNNFPNLITTNNMPSGLPTVTLDLREASGIEAIKKILDQIGYSFYIDADLDLHVFQAKSEVNSEHVISYGVNLSSVSGFGIELDFIKNKIKVYGGNVEGDANLFYLATKEDTTEQASSWTRTEIIEDNSIQSNTEAEATALAVLNENNASNPPSEGMLGVVHGLLSLQPAQMQECLVPDCNVDGFYEVTEITHTLDRDGLKAQVYAGRERPGMDTLFRKQNKRTDGVRIFQNPNGMKNSKIFLFEDLADFTTLTGINFSTDGTASLISGSNTGVLESDDTVDSYQYVERRTSGSQTSGVLLEVSRDGVTYTPVPEGSLVDLGSTSTRLIVRMSFSNTSPYTNPELKAAEVLMK